MCVGWTGKVQEYLPCYHKTSYLHEEEEHANLCSCVSPGFTDYVGKR